MAIAQQFELPVEQVRDVCLLHRKQPTSNAYWEPWCQLHHELPGKFWADEDCQGSIKTDSQSQFFCRKPELKVAQLFLSKSKSE